MKYFSWRWGFLSMLGVFLLVLTFLPDPNVQNLSSLTTHDLIDALVIQRPSVRRAVSEQLIARAKSVVPQLASAVRDAEEPQRSGLLDVLEELMLSADPVVAESAESALERLTFASSSLASEDAQRILTDNSSLRHARALANFRELHGILALPLLSPAVNADPAPPLLSPRQMRSPLQPRLLILESDWQGGDAGLRYLRRIFPGEPLYVHVTEDATVSHDALRELQTLRERVVVRHEHEACFGVSVDVRTDPDEIVVSLVVPESPADFAGIKVGDVILEFDGIATPRFNELIRKTQQRQPGDFVTLRLRRQGAVVRMKLSLGTDFRTGSCRCLDQAG